MHMKTEDHWHCTNPACKCEVRVETIAVRHGDDPRCSCGAVMKKRYASPMLAYLDFLRLAETSEAASREN
jgi:hypothetical protein